jgi:hypothetical protein
MHCNIACFCTGNDFLLKNEDDMVITTIDELFDGPWGTVEFRRKEIEAGSCGAFDRIFNEEVDNNFPPIQKLTVMIDYHESTVRVSRLLHKTIAIPSALPIGRRNSQYKAIRAGSRSEGIPNSRQASHCYLTLADLSAICDSLNDERGTGGQSKLALLLLLYPGEY